MSLEEFGNYRRGGDKQAGLVVCQHYETCQILERSTTRPVPIEHSQRLFIIDVSFDELVDPSWPRTGNSLQLLGCGKGHAHLNTFCVSAGAGHTHQIERALSVASPKRSSLLTENVSLLCVGDVEIFGGIDYFRLERALESLRKLHASLFIAVFAEPELLLRAR